MAAAYSCRIVPLDAPPAPRLLPESGQLTAIGCGARTIGPAPEARVASLFAERRAARAVALDELGNR